jgi:FkbM family methyltransferase
MVYNEPVFLPMWRAHYGNMVGEANCYVVDHGSDDGSTTDLGSISVIRIPRSPMHDQKRARFLSDFVSGLLEWYDVVAYTDVDEFLVADPERWTDFSAFCAELTGDAINCLGFEVYELPGVDGPLLPSVPVLRQRRWARFSLAMCKPLLVRSRVSWVPGFHASNHPMAFGDLFLFHLHNCDKGITLQRQAKTRAMPWGDGPPDHYQRWDDTQLLAVLNAVAGLERISDCTFRADDRQIQPILAEALAFWQMEPAKRHLFYFHRIKVPLLLFEIPERFVDALPCLDNGRAPPQREPLATGPAIGGQASIPEKVSAERAAPERPSDDACPAEVRCGDRVLRFAITHPKDHIERHLIEGRIYEADVLASLDHVIPDDAVIADVGANVGTHTVYFAAIRSARRVVPFEPNPILNAALVRNVALNGLKNVDLSMSTFALGRTEWQARLVVSHDENWGNGHLAVLENEEEEAPVSYEAIVQVRPLDSFAFDRLDLIKIDVEGFEVEVLRGGMKTLSLHRPVVFVEVGSSRAAELIKLLKGLGYEVIDYFTRYKGQRNYLFVPGG